MAAVADFAFDERPLGLLYRIQLMPVIGIGIIASLTLGLHCVPQLVFDHRLWCWWPRVNAANEAFAVAVPQLFAFSVEFENRHHLPTFPIRWSVNLQ
jgi:hypothetical protein